MFTPLDFSVECKAPITIALDAATAHLKSLGYEETERTVDSVTLRFAGTLLTTHLDEARHQTKIIATGASLHVHISWPWWLKGVLTDDERVRLRAQAEGAARAAAEKSTGGLPALRHTRSIESDRVSGLRIVILCNSQEEHA